MRLQTTLKALLLFFGLASAGIGQQVVATGKAIRNPQVAAVGTGGDFIVVWADLDNEAGTPSSSGVFARLFNASGQPKGPAFLVNAERAGDQLLPQVAADSQGRFLVVWQGGYFYDGNNVSPGGDGDGPGVFAQRFDRTGKRLGTSFRLNRTVAGDQLTPNVAMTPSGDFVAVWQDCTPRCSELHVGRFTAEGQHKGKDLKIPVLTATGYAGGGPVPNPTPYVAIETGGFAVGWTEQEACYKFEFEKFPVVVHYTASGEKVGERYRLDDGDCEDATGWTVAALTASQVGVTGAFFNGQRNSFQLFGPDGEPKGERKVVGRRNPQGTGFAEYIGDAAMRSNGDFAVVWVEFLTTDNTNQSFYQVQYFNALGRPISGRVQVASSPEELFTPAVAFAKDGLIVVWGNGYEAGSFRELLLRKQPLPRN